MIGSVVVKRVCQQVHLSLAGWTGETPPVGRCIYGMHALEFGQFILLTFFSLRQPYFDRIKGKDHETICV